MAFLNQQPFPLDSSISGHTVPSTYHTFPPFSSSSPSSSSSSPPSSLGSSPPTPTLGHVTSSDNVHFASSPLSSSPPCSNPQLPNESPKKKQPPRPTNSFMIYRTKMLNSLPRDTAAKLSKILGAKWRSEPPEVKEYYAELAKQAERKHAQQYPDYKFMPAKRGTGKKAQAVKAKTTIKTCSVQGVGQVVPSHATSFPLYAPSYSHKNFSVLYPYASSTTFNNHDYLSRRSGSTPGPLRATGNGLKSTRSCSTGSMAFRSSYGCVPGTSHYQSLDGSDPTAVLGAMSTSLYFDPYGTCQSTSTQFLPDPLQENLAFNDASNLIKAESRHQSQTDAAYLSRLLHADLAEAMDMHPTNVDGPRAFYMQQSVTDAPPAAVVGVSSPMGLSTMSTSDPSVQLLFSSGGSSLAATAPTSSSSPIVQSTAVATSYPIIVGSSPLSGNLTSIYSTQASTMAPIPIPMVSSTMSAPVRHVPVGSPFLGSSLTNQDMMISPVQSACSSFSPSMPVGTSLEQRYHHHPTVIRRSGETMHIKSEDNSGMEGKVSLNTTIQIPTQDVRHSGFA